MSVKEELIKTENLLKQMAEDLGTLNLNLNKVPLTPLSTSRKMTNTPNRSNNSNDRRSYPSPPLFQ